MAGKRKANRLHSFMFDVVAWMSSRSVQLMTPEAQGVYLWCLCEQWRNGPLPADLAVLSRLLPYCCEVFDRVWPEIAPHFALNPDGRLENERLAEQYGTVCAKVIKMRANGERGNIAIANAKGNAIAFADASAIANASLSTRASCSSSLITSSPIKAFRPETKEAIKETDTGEGGGERVGAGVEISPATVFEVATLPETRTGPRKPGGGPNAGGMGLLPVPFDEFYGPYPKKKARGDAEKAFRQVGADRCPQMLARIIAHVAAMRLHPDWIKDGGTFIPYPASYLRDRRWEDGPDEPLVARSGWDDAPDGQSETERLIAASVSSNHYQEGGGRDGF